MAATRKAAAVLCCALWLAGLAPPQATAATARAPIEKLFQAWIETLWPEARARKVTRATFDSAFAGVTLNWKLPDLRPPGSAPPKVSGKRQPEFGSPGRYFRKKHLKALVRIGKKKLAKHRAVLARVEARYGVPRRIVLALWGRETSYGAARIPYYTVRSLATLAFMGRRKKFFRPEVISALVILQQGHVTRARMKSSWAGAMGLTQMLPGHFLRYAVDFDGDGRRDIWDSIPDALATTANYLKKKGWKRGWDWGFEVKFANAASCILEGPHRRTKIAKWRKKGFKRTYKRRFSTGQLATPASLLAPAGAHGPAFLVTPNFYVIKTYNNSDLYALYIGHLADRLSRNRGFAGKWTKVTAYTRARTKVMQRFLKAKGYNIGDRLDGISGFRTRAAIGDYEHNQKLPVNCWPNPKLFELIE